MISTIGATSGISQAMMQQMQERMFAETDVDSDGYIDQTEMQAMADQMAEMTGVTVDISERFAEADINGDGLLDATEFAAMKPPEPPEGEMSGKMPPPPPMGTEGDTFESLLDALNASDDETRSIDILA